jgi:hypothetical protein
MTDKGPTLFLEKWIEGFSIELYFPNFLNMKFEVNSSVSMLISVSLRALFLSSSI